MGSYFVNDVTVVDVQPSACGAGHGSESGQQSAEGVGGADGSTSRNVSHQPRVLSSAMSTSASTYGWWVQE